MDTKKIARRGLKITTRCYICQDHVVDLDEHRAKGCKVAAQKNFFVCQKMVEDLSNHKKECSSRTNIL